MENNENNNIETQNSTEVNNTEVQNSTEANKTEVQNSTEANNTEVQNSTEVINTEVQNSTEANNTEVQNSTVVLSNDIDSNNEVVKEESDNALPIIDPLAPTVSTPPDDTQKIEVSEESDVHTVDPSTLNAPAPRVVNHNIASLNKTHEEVDNNQNKVEEVKKSEVEYKPPSKVRLFAMFLFFLLILFFILFLPDITTLINNYGNKDVEENNENVSSGELRCNLKSNTANLDKDYYSIFYFNYRKLYKVELEITTKGDSTEDVSALDAINNTCENLRQKVVGMNGVSISCVNMEGKVIERQTYDLASLDVESLNSSFAEAGGTIMEYKDGQDIGSVQNNLETSGYQCIVISDN